MKGDTTALSYSITLPPGRYAMLLRKSREDEDAERQGRFETLKYHEAQLHRLEAQLGIHIAEEDIYRELQSGEILSNCHEVMRCVRNVAQKVYAGVLVVTGPRLTRGDAADRGTILSAFTYSRTLIITPGKIYDPANEGDMLTLEIELLVGHRELGNITAQFATGKINKTEDGQYLAARAPFGWRKVTRDRMKTLEPNEDNPTLVQWYTDLAAGRTTADAIAKDRNERGLLTPRGAYWTASAVARIIRSPVNKGYVFWGQKKVVTEYTENLQKRKKLVRTPPEEWHMKPGLHNGCVSEEVWQAAVDHVGLCAPRARKSYELKDPLAGLIKCRECGHGMHRRYDPSNSVKERYVHARMNRHECWCMGAAVPDVMALLARSLEQITEDLTVSDDDSEERRSSAMGRIALMEKDIADAMAGRERLFSLVEKGFIDDEDFYRRKLALDDRIRETGEQIDRLRDEAGGIIDNEARVVRLREAVAACADYEGRVAEVNAALKSIIERIDYSKDPDTREIHLEVWIK